MIKSIWSNVSLKAYVSLSIFSLDDLFIDESGVLKSTTIIVLLLIALFMVVSIGLGQSFSRFLITSWTWGSSSQPRFCAVVTAATFLHCGHSRHVSAPPSQETWRNFLANPIFTSYIEVLLCWMHIYLQLYLLLGSIFSLLDSDLLVSCTSFYLKSIRMIWVCCSTFLLIHICTEYLFPSHHFRSLCVPKSEVDLL